MTNKESIQDTEEMFKEFREKWDKMSSIDREETLLNMILNVGYRMDILAGIISQLPDIKAIHDKMDDELKSVLNGDYPLPKD